MKGPLITSEIMNKAWLLHNKGVDSNLIASTLDISQHSATRIIKLMTTAQNGGDVDAADQPGNYKRQKDFAREFFGIKKQEEVKPEEKHEEKANTDADMKECKGVERR